MHVDDLVDTVEMYLKAVLELEEEGVVAMRARLVERFEHSSPTVSQTVERLQRGGLIELEADRHLTLTERGRRTAASVMRKHRLAEVFLDRVVGLEWELLHEEACRWEHVMSDRVAGLLDELLEHPATTPYGNTVHAVDGTGRSRALRATNLVRLTVAAPAKQVTAQLVWIGEPLQANPAALASLAGNGLVPGAQLTSVSHGPELLVRPEGSGFDVEVPHAIAAHLFATERPRAAAAVELLG